MSRSLYFALDMLEEMSHNNEDEKNTSTTKVKFIIQIVFFTLSIQTKLNLLSCICPSAVQLHQNTWIPVRDWPVLCVLSGGHCDECRVLHGIKELGILIFITRLFFVQPLTPPCQDMWTYAYVSQCTWRWVQERAVYNHTPMVINQGIISFVKLSMFLLVSSPETGAPQGELLILSIRRPIQYFLKVILFKDESKLCDLQSLNNHQYKLNGLYYSKIVVVHHILSKPASVSFNLVRFNYITWLMSLVSHSSTASIGLCKRHNTEV